MQLLDLLEHKILLPGQPDLLLVLLQDIQLVPQLMSCLQGDGEQQEDVIDPEDHTLGLVSVKPFGREEVILLLFILFSYYRGSGPCCSSTPACA
jgi:hypothetical protein